MQLTFHAIQRSRQRGTRHSTLELIFRFADREAFVGSGAQHIFVSRSMIARLLETGLPHALVNQLRSTSLLIDPDSNTVITVLRGPDAHGIKRYRQGRYGFAA